MGVVHQSIDQITSMKSNHLIMNTASSTYYGAIIISVSCDGALVWLLSKTSQSDHFTDYTGSRLSSVILWVEPLALRHTWCGMSVLCLAWSAAIDVCYLDGVITFPKWILFTWLRRTVTREKCQHCCCCGIQMYESQQLSWYNVAIVNTCIQCPVTVNTCFMKLVIVPHYNQISTSNSGVIHISDESFQEH